MAIPIRTRCRVTSLWCFRCPGNCSAVGQAMDGEYSIQWQLFPRHLLISAGTSTAWPGSYQTPFAQPAPPR